MVCSSGYQNLSDIANASLLSSRVTTCAYICRPVNRGTLTRHLRNITKPPGKPTKNGLLSFAGNAAKFAIKGAVVYLAVTALQGQRGKDRLKEDLHAVAVSPCEESAIADQYSSMLCSATPTL